MKRIAILGATGSIGRSTLDLVEAAPDRFQVTAVTAASNVAELADIARRTGASLAVIADEGRLPELRAALSGTNHPCDGGQGGARRSRGLGRPGDRRHRGHRRPRPSHGRRPSRQHASRSPIRKRSSPPAR
jgi:hypothetical protein